jgi:hypothetical protein
VHRTQATSLGTLLVLAAGAASFFLSLEFWAIDICADAGGAYRSFTFQCSGVDTEFRQIWSRPWTLWLLVLAFPAYITLAAVVTRKVALSGAYTAKQKVAQSGLVWLLPIVGLALVGWFVQHGSAPLPKAPVDPYPREPELPG